MKKNYLIISIFIVLIVLSGCSSKNEIDSQNEKILQRLLEIDDISVNNIDIDRDTIFVSIEVSAANEHDNHLIEWWGTIFGFSSILTGDYLLVIIENTVNYEPYTYISSNVYSIRDFEEGLITDIEFWQESLITSNMPRKRDILEASNLPIHTLSDERGFTMPTKFEIFGYDFSWLIRYLIIGLIVIAAGILIIIGIKKGSKIKNLYSNTKKHREKLSKTYKEKIVPKTKELGSKAKKTYNEKVAPKAKELTQKAKKKTKELMEKTKNYSAEEEKK